jgi:DNA-binding protein YbaB
MDIESLKAQLEKMQQMMQGAQQLQNNAKVKGPQQGAMIKMLIAMGNKPDMIEEALDAYENLAIDI